MTSEGAVLLLGVNVLTMRTPGVLNDQAVQIKCGRIITVEPRFDRRPGDFHGTDVCVLWRQGMYLMPGLADMHVHLTHAADLAAYLRHGVTFVRNMAGSPGHMRIARLLDAKAIAGPRMLTTTPILDGPQRNGDPVSQTRLCSPRQARKEGAQFLATGYRQIKTYHHLGESCLRALGETALERGARVTGHCPERLTFRQAMDCGMSCFEHLLGIARPDGHARLLQARQPRSGASEQEVEAAWLCNPHNLAPLPELAHEMRDRDIWNCPTLTVRQMRALTLQEADARIAAAPARHRMNWLRTFENEALTSEHNLRLKVLRQLQQVVWSLWHSGAPIVVGTDAPNPLILPGQSTWEEIRNLVACGIPAYYALACATIEAARFLREDSDWGTVEPGRRADLVLLRGNPLEALDERLIESVWVGGSHYDRFDLDRLARPNADTAQ